jgi:hypothetical protein
VARCTATLKRWRALRRRPVASRLVLGSVRAVPRSVGRSGVDGVCGGRRCPLGCEIASRGTAPPCDAAGDRSGRRRVRVRHCAIAGGTHCASWCGGHSGPATELLVGSLGLWLGLKSACVYVSLRRGTGSLPRDFNLSFRWRDLGFGLAGCVVARMLAIAAWCRFPLPMPTRRIGESERGSRALFELRP